MRCFYYRWMLDRCLDEGAALSRGLERHLAGCVACRRHAEARVRLEGRLRASVLPIAPQPFLAERVLAATRRRSAGHTAPFVRIRPMWAGAAFAAMVVAAIFLQRGVERAPSGEEALRLGRACVQPLSLLEGADGESGVPVWQTWPGGLYADEAASLAADARAAGRFFLECLPSVDVSDRASGAL